MARKASAIVAPSLRIREDLRRRLEREAKRHGRSLNGEMVLRLEQSLEGDKDFNINHAVIDLQIAVLKISEYITPREIENEIIQAVESKNFDEAHALVGSLRRHQASVAQQLAALKAEKGESE